jgi:hypothetical protein
VAPPVNIPPSRHHQPPAVAKPVPVGMTARRRRWLISSTAFLVVAGVIATRTRRRSQR